MSPIAKKTFNMIEMLPDEEQELLYEMVKRFILAWDPDFTKVTPEERKKMEIAEKELENGEYVSEDEVWKQLGI